MKENGRKHSSKGVFMVLKSYDTYTPVVVDMDEYEDAVENYIGFCPDCGEFSRENTEPDAEHYHCDLCENINVLGAEQALIIGLIVFET
jgi:hypothetical protein